MTREEQEEWERETLDELFQLRDDVERLERELHGAREERDRWVKRNAVLEDRLSRIREIVK